MISSSDVPVIFADGIFNFTNSTEVAKFYLHRFDPPSRELFGVEQSNPVAAAQVVMPMKSVLNVAAFLKKAIEVLCERDVALAAQWKAAQTDAAVSSKE